MWIHWRFRTKLNNCEENWKSWNVPTKKKKRTNKPSKTGKRDWNDRSAGSTWSLENSTTGPQATHYQRGEGQSSPDGEPSLHNMCPSISTIS